MIFFCVNLCKTSVYRMLQYVCLGSMKLSSSAVCVCVVHACMDGSLNVLQI